MTNIFYDSCDETLPLKQSVSGSIWVGAFEALFSSVGCFQWLPATACKEGPVQLCYIVYDEWMSVSTNWYLPI